MMIDPVLLTSPRISTYQGQNLLTTAGSFVFERG